MDTFPFVAHATFEPRIENGSLPTEFSSVLACGMGGSALPIRIMAGLDTRTPFLLHDTFGLPARIPKNTLCVAISYSGETEETLSFAREAHGRSLPLVVITTGGALAAFAEENGLPLVRFGHEDRPARDMVLPMLRGLLYVSGENEQLDECAAITADIMDDAAVEGSRIAKTLSHSIPVVYASHANSAVAYIWKIMCNETAGIPAFASTIPEAFHNELEGFGPKMNEEKGAFCALCVRSEEDRAELQGRTDAFAKLLSEREIPLETLELTGANALERRVYGWLVARAATRTLSETTGIDPHATPFITTFKSML